MKSKQMFTLMAKFKFLQQCLPKGENSITIAELSKLLNTNQKTVLEILKLLKVKILKE